MPASPHQIEVLTEGKRFKNDNKGPRRRARADPDQPGNQESEKAVQFDFERMGALERYRLLLATVLPRPIAWVTTRDSAGAINAAPFSFFNVFGSDPATVGIGIGSKGPAEPKDTRANIRTNKQFVVNLVPFALAE
jgi:flavin reductase (DIM6/NTAB) family NADH-FMN oxidoreductase RutF